MRKEAPRRGTVHTGSPDAIRVVGDRAEVAGWGLMVPDVPDVKLPS